MNNYAVIKKAFEEVHVSDEMLKKIKSIDVKSSNLELDRRIRKRKRSTFKVVSYVAAALAFCLLASNLISLMMNGKAWIAGNDSEDLQDSNQQTDFSKVPDMVNVYRDIFPEYFENDNEADLYPKGDIVFENDKYQLVIEEYDIVIDVTDKLLISGYCDGEFFIDNTQYHYEIDLTNGVFEVKINIVE